jgi:hypothetical protein
MGDIFDQVAASSGDVFDRVSVGPDWTKVSAAKLIAAGTDAKRGITPEKHVERVLANPRSTEAERAWVREVWRRGVVAPKTYVQPLPDSVRQRYGLPSLSEALSRKLNRVQTERELLNASVTDRPWIETGLANAGRAINALGSYLTHNETPRSFRDRMMEAPASVLPPSWAPKEGDPWPLRYAKEVAQFAEPSNLVAMALLHGGGPMAEQLGISMLAPAGQEVEDLIRAGKWSDASAKLAALGTVFVAPGALKVGREAGINAPREALRLGIERGVERVRSLPGELPPLGARRAGAVPGVEVPVLPVGGAEPYGRGKVRQEAAPVAPSEPVVEPGPVESASVETAGKPGPVAFPITEADIRSAFPRSQVEVDGDGWFVTLPNRRKVSVGRVPEIAADEVSGAEGVPAGAFVLYGVDNMGRLDADGAIWLSERGLAAADTVHHEAFHAAWEWALNAKQRTVLERAFGSEEGAAERYASTWGQIGEAPRSAFGRIQQWASGLVERVFRPSEFGARQALESVKSGEVWDEKAPERPGEPLSSTDPTQSGASGVDITQSPGSVTQHLENISSVEPDIRFSVTKPLVRVAEHLGMPERAKSVQRAVQELSQVGLEINRVIRGAGAPLFGKGNPMGARANAENISRVLADYPEFRSRVWRIREQLSQELGADVPFVDASGRVPRSLIEERLTASGRQEVAGFERKLAQHMLDYLPDEVFEEWRQSLYKATQWAYKNGRAPDLELTVPGSGRGVEHVRPSNLFDLPLDKIDEGDFALGHPLKGAMKTVAALNLTTACPMFDVAGDGCYIDACYVVDVMGKGSLSTTVYSRAAYTGEILRLSNGAIKGIKKTGGLRVNGGGDTTLKVIAQFRDILRDARARDLPLKVITKQPETFEMFDLLRKEGFDTSRVMLQPTVDPYWVGEPGSPSWRKYGFPIESAEALAKRYPELNIRPRVVVANPAEIVYYALNHPECIQTWMHARPREGLYSEVLKRKMTLDDWRNYERDYIIAKDPETGEWGTWAAGKKKRPDDRQRVVEALELAERTGSLDDVAHLKLQIKQMDERARKMEMVRDELGDELDAYIRENVPADKINDVYETLRRLKCCAAGLDRNICNTCLSHCNGLNPSSGPLVKLGESQYKQAGGVKYQIRPSAVQGAAEEVATGARGLKDFMVKVVRVVDPTAWSEPAKVVARSARQKLSTMAREADQAEVALRGASRALMDWTAKAPSSSGGKPTSDEVFARRIGLQDAMDTGARTGDKSIDDAMGEFGKVYRHWADEVVKRDLLDADFVRDHFFAHFWKDDPRRAQQLSGMLMGRRPLQGSEAFKHGRKYATVMDGLLAGKVPVSDDPLLMTMAKVREYQRACMAADLIAEQTALGNVLPIYKGKPVLPGFEEIGGQRFTMGRIQARPEVAQILNNYLSPGLLGRTDVAGSAYRGLMNIGNAMNSAQLWGGFHAAFIAAEAVTSDMALALQYGASGKPVSAAATAARALSMAGTLANIVKRGSQVKRAWENPGYGTPELQQVVSMIEAGGGRSKMGNEFALRMTGRDAVEAFMVALREKKPIKATLSAPLAALRLTMIPLMDVMVPMSKRAALYNMMRFELDRLGVDKDVTRESILSSDKLRKIAAGVVDSVDNREGQLTYDNLMLNRSIKDLMFVMLRAPGWQIGYREFLGAGKDLGEIPLRAQSRDPIFTRRMAYAIALPLTTAYMAALYQYFHTGKLPDEPEDYLRPKTGRILPDGNPERVNLPTYMRDWNNLGDAIRLHGGPGVPKELGQMARNKLNPIWQWWSTVANNQDYRGDRISDAEPYTSDWFGDIIRYTSRTAFTPFSFESYNRRKRQTGGSVASALESLAGIQPAPRKAYQTPATALIADYVDAQRPIGGKGALERRRLDAISAIRDAMRSGQDMSALVTQAVADGLVSRDDLKRLRREAGSGAPASVVQFGRLRPEQMISVMERASAKEREQFLPEFVQKYRSVARGRQSTAPPAVVRRMGELLGARP